MKERVRVLKGVQRIDLLHEQLGPLEEGEETQLWSWQAKILEKHGLVECQRIGTTDLRRLIIAEERNSNLEKLPENFYFLMRGEISKLRRSGDHEEAERLKSGLAALLEIRLPKLLMLSLSPEDSGEILAEEKFLINRLASVLRNWNKKIERFLETGGEVNLGDVTGVI
jgi:hypothetical protein